MYCEESDKNKGSDRNKASVSNNESFGNIIALMLNQVRG